MKYVFRAIALTLLLFIGASLSADDAVTLTGEYTWSADNTGGALEAVFTPTGAGTWNVVFNLVFAGEARSLAGTATGRLDHGHYLRGQLQDDRVSSVSYVFEGWSNNGQFEGSHTTKQGNNETYTGTLVLSQ